jgi:hypothetical protein
MPSPASPLHQPYIQLKQAASKDLRSPATSERLHDIILISLDFLTSQCVTLDLISLVPGKTYFAYALKTNPRLFSRPVNRALFNPDRKIVSQQWQAWSSGKMGKQSTDSVAYTMATAYSIATDLFDRNNKKGPATYFECMIGHLFARELGVNPTKKVSLPVVGRNIRMTMDFQFDVGKDRPKVHLPVKMSTRERVVQAWAHQRLLDAAYGHAKYRGILVVHSETKLNLRNKEVVEICVPDQWLAYQTFLAKMDRIYYFDMPNRYAELARQFPDRIQLKPFAEFFKEKDKVLSAPILEE